jgi:hypothetical protein
VWRPRPAWYRPSEARRRPVAAYDGHPVQSEAPPIHAQYRVAVRRPTDDAILVQRDGSLLTFEVADAPAWPVVAPVVASLRTGFGVDVAVLRAVAVEGFGAGSAVADRLYEAEWLAGTPPDGSRWTDRADLPDPVQAALEPATGDRQPWYRPGWFQVMSRWVDARLDEAGIRRTGSLEQVRSWGRSALLSVDTDHGRLWAKDVPMVFVHEVMVTDLLADVDPGLVPPLVAADLATGRMLLEHVAGPALTEMPDRPDAWTATLARLAEAQRVLAEDVAVLSVASVAPAPLDDLAGRVPDLLADDDLLLVDRPGGLARDEAATLRSRAGEFDDAVGRLAADGIPPSLDHGDLSATQVIVGDMGPVIIDWSDASVTHPFLAAASFLMDPSSHPAGSADDLVEAYLAGWAADASPAALRESLELARIVHPLHTAQAYADRILPGLEQRWEMERVAPRVLRTLLARPTVPSR